VLEQPFFPVVVHQSFICWLINLFIYLLLYLFILFYFSCSTRLHSSVPSPKSVPSTTPSSSSPLSTQPLLAGYTYAPSKTPVTSSPTAAACQSMQQYLQGKSLPQFGVFFQLQYTSSLNLGLNLSATIRAFLSDSCALLSELVSTVVGSETSALVVYMNPAQANLGFALDVSTWQLQLQAAYLNRHARLLLAQSASVFIEQYCDALGNVCPRPSFSPSATGAASRSGSTSSENNTTAGIIAAAVTMTLLLLLLLLCFCRQLRKKKEVQAKISPYATNIPTLLVRKTSVIPRAEPKVALITLITLNLITNNHNNPNKPNKSNTPNNPNNLKYPMIVMVSGRGRALHAGGECWRESP
jgi:hypothetical protein